MEISSTNSSIYSSTSTTQTTSNVQNTNSSFDSLLNNQSSTPETVKKETFRVVAFIDKYNGFSSLSPTDEKIFRDILSDDKLTMEEVKSLSYEQVKKINDFIGLTFSKASSCEAPIIKGIDFRIEAMLHATIITDNENFNKAIFETVQTINDPIEMMDFFDELSDELGWNDKTCLIPERDIPELRKNSTKEDWQILDYKKFIEANVARLNAILKNPVYDEDKEMYQKLLTSFSTLQKNHNEILNKTKYI
jgi:hypothetical protein